MNSINLVLFSLANELTALLSIQDYKSFGVLKFASKPLFQLGFDQGILLMDKSIEDDQYVETFKITGTDQIFELSLIGLNYQVNEFSYNEDDDFLTDQQQFHPCEY